MSKRIMTKPKAINHKKLVAFVLPITGCEKAQCGEKQLKAGETDEGDQKINAVRGCDLLCELVYHRDILLRIGEKE